MSFKVNVQLVQTSKKGIGGRGNRRPVDRVLEEFETDVDDERDGGELLEGISTFIEELGYEVFEEDDERDEERDEA